MCMCSGMSGCVGDGVGVNVVVNVYVYECYCVHLSADFCSKVVCILVNLCAFV